ncbi:unnamed protein product [Protopolystoma xenopodis]|uniref:Uncharacterized protein n=1 Tax=Protopolystoma xenopodis TaxID=117903 RepID=A0A448XG24_9PLAT|nr:unnamed protein product [Protopolystoma xenopodis]
MASAESPVAVAVIPGVNRPKTQSVSRRMTRSTTAVTAASLEVARNGIKVGGGVFLSTSQSRSVDGSLISSDMKSYKETEPSTFDDGFMDSPNLGSGVPSPGCGELRNGKRRVQISRLDEDRENGCEEYTIRAMPFGDETENKFSHEAGENEFDDDEEDEEDEEEDEDFDDIFGESYDDLSIDDGAV